MNCLIPDEKKAIIEKSPYQCRDGCNDTDIRFDYLEFITHITDECSAIEKFCPMRCGKKYNFDGMKAHLENNDCNKYSYKCKICSVVFKKNDTNDHYCFQKYILDFLKFKVCTLESEVTDYKTKFEASEKQVAILKSY